MKAESYTTIWKFSVSIQDTLIITMPKNARILDLQVQDNQATIWVLVNPGNEKEERRFRIIGTGDPLPQEIALDYIGTIQMPPLVWHLFEEM